MHTSVFVVISVHWLASAGTVRRGRLAGPSNRMEHKRKIELPPFQIDCELTDMLIISAPVVRTEETLYHLNRPNGDVTQLNLTLPVPRGTSVFTTADYYDNIESIVSNIAEENAVIDISPMTRYKIFNANAGETIKSGDTFGAELRTMNANEFTVGPLGEEDHGNWVLSLYCTDGRGQRFEVYQVFSVVIKEALPARQGSVRLKVGEAFRPMFAYPIRYLQSCQLDAPPTTFDRRYDRTHFHPDRCSYIVRNVTTDDAGSWHIIAVGRIVYETWITLEVS